MRGYRYLEHTATLRVDPQRCVGCGLCVSVCPHRLFALEGRALLEAFQAQDTLGQLAFRVYYFPALQHDQDQRDHP